LSELERREAALRSTRWLAGPFLAAVFMAAASCRQPAASPTSRNLPTPAPTPPNVVLGKVDACTYLTAEDAAAVLGGSVKMVKATHEDLANTHASRCAYMTNEVPLRVVNLYLQQLPNPEQAARGFEFRRETAPTVSGIPAKAVPDLGDRAFWEGGSAQKLHVLRGNLWMVFGASLGPQNDQEAPARAAAALALKRF
jgi:hypothetical protein